MVHAAVPSGQEPTVELETHDDWRDADVGEVLSQDFAKMHEVTVGMHSCSFAGLHLNLRQEFLILRHHDVADRYLFGG